MPPVPPVARRAVGVAARQARLAHASTCVVAGDAPAHQVVEAVRTALAARDDVVGHDTAATAPGRGAGGVETDALGAQAAPFLGAVEGIAHAAPLRIASARR